MPLTPATKEAAEQFARILTRAKKIHLWNQAHEREYAAFGDPDIPKPISTPKLRELLQKAAESARIRAELAELPWEVDGVRVPQAAARQMFLATAPSRKLIQKAVMVALHDMVRELNLSHLIKTANMRHRGGRQLKKTGDAARRERHRQRALHVYELYQRFRPDYPPGARGNRQAREEVMHRFRPDGRPVCAQTICNLLKAATTKYLPQNPTNTREKHSKRKSE